MPGAESSSAPTRNLWAAGRVLLLTLIALAPWAYGSVPPEWELVLSLGVLALVCLWAAHAILTQHLAYQGDLISTCLLGLVVITATQLVPLPESIVRVVSPAAADWHMTLAPEVTELLPGETEADAPKRSRWVRLSVAPARTQDLLVELLTAFLVYAATRNFVLIPSATESLRRLAWVAFVVGILLALLGLLQAISGDRTRIYWHTVTETQSFGSYRNKNHFVFEINLLMGLAGGLFVTVARRKGWRSPLALGMLAGMGLMATAVAFSESRGGLLAALVAGVFVALVAWLRGRAHKASSETPLGLVLALGVAVIASVLIVWLGWHRVVDRVATLWDGKADIRAANWRSVWPLVERFPLTGVGGGGLARAEPTVRTRPELTIVFNTLDNEYLEALVEGGLGRFFLTIGLGIVAAWGAVRGYQRTGDPLLLGSAFGLVAVACQSVGDFGLHVPSVALTAAVVAAHASARSRSHATPSRGSGERGEWIFTGKTAYIAAALLLITALAIALTDWRNYRATAYQDVAIALSRSSSPERRDDVIRLLEAVTRIRPDDPTAWELLMFTHLAASTERQQATAAAVAGFAVLAGSADAATTGDPDGHIAAAIRAARNARACQRLSPTSHLVLGTYASHFTRAEPATVHFDRAKRIAAFDPDVWYSSGRAAAWRGDWPAAAADWRESLARSQKRLQPIGRLASSRFSPDEVRSRVLPDDPAVWLAATPFIFSPTDDMGRVAWFKAIADRSLAVPEPTTIAGFIVWTTALEQLGDSVGALRVWRRAVERFPDDVVARDHFAAALASEELYEEAVPILEWLIARHPNPGEYRERLAAARHALKLKAEINGVSNP